MQVKRGGDDRDPAGQPINAHWPEDLAAFNKAVNYIQHENEADISALLASSKGAILHSVDANGARIMLIMLLA